MQEQNKNKGRNLSSFGIEIAIFLIFIVIVSIISKLGGHILSFVFEPLESYENSSVVDLIAAIDLRVFILAAAITIILFIVMVIYGTVTQLSNDDGNKFEISDIDTLFLIIKGTKCKFIKEMRLDGMGNILIRGSRKEYHVYLENGIVSFEDIKGNSLKALITRFEQDSIIDHLRCMEKGKDTGSAGTRFNVNVALAKARQIAKWITQGTAVIFLACIIYIAYENSYVEMVKNASPSTFPSITYNEAFGGFFDEGDWKHFIGTKGQNVVEYSGKITRGDITCEVFFQFQVDKKNNTVTTEYASLNDVPLNYLEMGLLINGIFAGEAVSEVVKGILEEDSAHNNDFEDISRDNGKSLTQQEEETKNHIEEVPKEEAESQDSNKDDYIDWNIADDDYNDLYYAGRYASADGRIVDFSVYSSRESGSAEVGIMEFSSGERVSIYRASQSIIKEFGFETDEVSYFGIGEENVYVMTIYIGQDFMLRITSDGENWDLYQMVGSFEN